MGREVDVALDGLVEGYLLEARRDLVPFVPQSAANACRVAREVLVLKHNHRERIVPLPACFLSQLLKCDQVPCFWVHRGVLDELAHFINQEQRARETLCSSDRREIAHQFPGNRVDGAPLVEARLAQMALQGVCPFALVPAFQSAMDFRFQR